MDPSSTVVTIVGLVMSIQNAVEMRARNKTRMKDVIQEIDKSLDTFAELVESDKVNSGTILGNLLSDLRRIQEICKERTVIKGKGPSLWWKKLLSLMHTDECYRELILILKRIDHAYLKIVVELLVKQTAKIAQIQESLVHQRIVDLDRELGPGKLGLDN